MIEVNIKNNESLERALRRFKKKWERSGVLKDVKRKAFYEKPSVTKRIAKKQTIRRAVRLAKFNNYLVDNSSFNSSQKFLIF